MIEQTGFPFESVKSNSSNQNALIIALLLAIIILATVVITSRKLKTSRDINTAKEVTIQ